MEDIKAKVETTETTHNDFNRAIIAIGFLVICILALTYGEYKMGKALDKAFSERQMLLDRIEVLETKITSVAANTIDGTTVYYSISDEHDTDGIGEPEDGVSNSAVKEQEQIEENDELLPVEVQHKQ